MTMSSAQTPGVAAEAPTGVVGELQGVPQRDYSVDCEVDSNQPDEAFVFEVDAFHDELRQRNLPILFWATTLFNVAYVAWGIFDFILVPEHWIYFALLRVSCVTITSLVLVVVFRLGFQRYTWEGLCCVGLSYCTFIAVMLPSTGDSLSRYVMGFAVVLLAGGVIPVWPFRWGISILVSSAAIGTAVFFLNFDGDIPGREIVGSSYVVATCLGLSVVATIFKYDLVKRDYISRLQVAAVARRESKARQDLARTSADLEKALRKLEELDRLKSKFFANISHELRTPLTLVLAPLEELASLISDDHQRQRLRVVRRNAERLLGLINDLLDLSRLDAGGLRLNLAKMDVRSVVASVHENAQPAALAKSIDFVLQMSPSDQRIIGDAHRLEIVITNLVSNSLKFTGEGGRVELRVIDRDRDVVIQIEDSGHGIPREHLPRVFERFFQVDLNDRRREGGLGIGLALAKELIDLHGGTIGVESEEGSYTRFTVSIPFGGEHIKPEAIERREQFERTIIMGRRVDDGVASEVKYKAQVGQVSQSKKPPNLVELRGGRAARILLVEDHKDMREYIMTLLQPQFVVETAENGREALELIRKNPPDLVVSDVMMAEMSGNELCRAVKSDPALCLTPIILLTARVGSEATLEAYSHGADDFVAKPFHPKVLMARIRAQLKLRVLGLQLAQHEKLAVVGTLAAGILHEVRNPVNAIMNAARLLSSGLARDEDTTKLINVIADGAERIEGITRALDSHARPAEGGETTTCDVQEGIDSTLRLLAHRLGGVSVNRDFSTDRFAQVPAGPLNQVFLNLLDNAIRAGTGIISIRIDEEDDILRISIGDDGQGISPEDVERVFDPFYSNRKDGSGTGLGLFLSRQIVEQHGGTLRLQTSEYGGAEFVIGVPAIGHEWTR
jgi:signal transduction histidine kinase